MLFFTSEHHAKSAGFSSSLTIKIKKKNEARSKSHKMKQS